MIQTYLYLKTPLSWGRFLSKARPNWSSMQHTTGTCSYIHRAPLLHCLPSIRSSDKCFGLRRPSTRDLKTCWSARFRIWHIQLFPGDIATWSHHPRIFRKNKMKREVQLQGWKGKKIALMLFENSFFMNFRYPSTCINHASRTQTQQAIATSCLYLDQPRHDMGSAVFHSVDPSESLAFCVQNVVRWLGAGSSQWTETCPIKSYLRVTYWRQEGTRKEPKELE